MTVRRLGGVTHFVEACRGGSEWVVIDMCADWNTTRDVITALGRVSCLYVSIACSDHASCSVCVLGIHWTEACWSVGTDGVVAVFRSTSASCFTKDKLCHPVGR